jgi:hypothetical protein
MKVRIIKDPDKEPIEETDGEKWLRRLANIMDVLAVIFTISIAIIFFSLPSMDSLTGIYLIIISIGGILSCLTFHYILSALYSILRYIRQIKNMLEE